MERKIQYGAFSGGVPANPRCCQAECLNGGIHLVAFSRAAFNSWSSKTGVISNSIRPPHISEFKKLLRVICLQEVESAAEISSRPSSKELHPFRGLCTRFSESLNSFSTRLRVGVPMECQNEFHGCFVSLLLYGRSSLPDNHNG